MKLCSNLMKAATLLLCASASVPVKAENVSGLSKSIVQYANGVRGPPGRHTCGSIFTACGSVVKRQLHSVEDQNITLRYDHNALARRTIVLPEGNSREAMDKFMSKECAKTPVRGCPRENVHLSENTASLVTWDQKEERSVNVARLVGCTALVLVSRRGVFMGHYFEDISFDPEARWLRKYGGKENAFDKTVIDLIKNGKRAKNAHPSLAAVKEKIDDSSLRAWLVIPSDGATDGQGNAVTDPYRDAWTKLESFVKREFPQLNQDLRWSEVKYTPRQNEEKLYDPKIFDIAVEVTKKSREELDKDGQIDWALLDQNQILEITTEAEGLVTDDPIDSGARGKVVVKHDPDTNGKNKVMMWMEYSTLYEDDW
ncbi:hypothetical protein CkaCkLH20_09378 [Colletotrichum karsti]|uniref:Uncharacterized protein n=1 Tax=Colletotrichum karsti TaxID=1095194 RepID=A0A9P6HZV7_9PEZI|nr:uncharacterized protein CkaCkLH20_09378 [Colletotrichum karsti]KAF9873215.1 hypothetical protein CkaCkLH20_09378 [Colletotrichum karsti]